MAKVICGIISASFLMVGGMALLFCTSSRPQSEFIRPEVDFTEHLGKVPVWTTRNLKVDHGCQSPSTIKIITTNHMVVNQDYDLTDPVPASSKTSVKHGPIQHGSPIIPYIPKHSPSPPGNPPSP